MRQILSLTKVRSENMVLRMLCDRRGVSDIVGTILMLVGVLVLGGGVVAFAKAGGLTWVNNTLNSITTYTP